LSFRDSGQRAFRLFSGRGGNESDSTDSGSASSDLSTPGLEFLARAAFIAAALYVLSTGLKIYRGSGIWGPGIPIGLILYVLAAVCLVAAFTVKDPARFRSQVVIGVVLLLAIVFSVWYEIDFANPTYGTDALALAHSAGEVLIDGQNPYEVVGGSLGDVLERFNVPDTFVTRTTTGREIERLVSYPGGHVLTYAGGVAVGLHDLRWVTLVFEIGSLILIWSLVSPIGRLFIPFALLLEGNLTVYFTSGAVTDWLWVLPLVGAAFYLNRERFGYAGLALGLACAMKQQPWFLVPFAIVWVYRTLQRRGEPRQLVDGMTGFLAGTASGFLILNLPFIVWSFRDWVQGILHPLLGDLVPDGQGFSVLTSRGLLPIPGTWYSVTLLLVGVLTLWAYSKWFDRMQDLLWVLPPALLLLSARSFHSYFIYWAPLALLWLDLRINRPGSIESATPGAGFRSNTSRVFAIAAVAVAVGLGSAAILTLTTRTIEVGEVTPVVEDGVIRSLEVDVTNSSDETIEPVFEVYWIDSPVPWSPSGDSDVAAHDTKTVEISPNSAQGIPPTQLSPEGVEVADFRVRVNDSGSSVYTSSDVVHIEIDDPVVNPTLGNWDREGTVFAAPYGWRAAVHGGTSGQRRIAPADGDAGVLLGVSSNGAGPAEWVEAAIIQDVAFFASCYSWDFDHDLGLRSDSAGSPLAVSGVQIVQDDASLWFVLSDGADRQATTLADGTRLVEVAARSNQRASTVLDVASQAQAAGIDLEQGGIIKVFNAVHETIAARSESITYRLAGECPDG
jgi:hypothetical protein